MTRATEAPGRNPVRWFPSRPRFLDRVLDERARLLWHILYFFVVVFIPVAIIGVSVSLDPPMALGIYGGVLAAAGVAFVLLARRRVTAAAAILCVSVSAIVALTVLGVGRPGSIFAAGFIPLALLARATLGARHGLIATTLYVGFLAVAVALHLAGHYPAPFVPVTPFDETLAAIVFLLTSTVFTFVTTRTLEDTVEGARAAVATERALAAQARALAQLGTDALAHPSVQLAEDVVQQAQALPGARWAAVISLARKDVAVTTSGLVAEVRSEIEQRATDIVTGRELGGFASAPTIVRCELTTPDGPAGTLIAGFDAPASGAAAASFLKTAASLLSSAIDRERRQDELIRVQKRDAAGRIAANISHDVNNLLAAIAADAWALGQVTIGPAKDISQQILDATRRGALLTGRLRALDRNVGSLAERVMLDHAVERFVEGLRRRRLGGIEIMLEHDRSSLPIVVDRGDLEQVLDALTSNALAAMPTGGKLVLRLGRSATAATPTAELEVIDTGIGMDEATRERLFEPFFTTRATSAGLGLALTREVLERVGGAIEIASTPGRGTHVTVRVPLSDGGEASAAAGPTSEVVSREVLLVEDDALVRRSVARLLTRSGYTVVEASDGMAALDLLATHPSIRMVVSDITMPRMGGVELAERVRAERGLPVLLMTGHTDRQGIDPDVPVLAKPFAPGDLLDAVARSIGAPTAALAPTHEDLARPTATPAREDAHGLFVAMVVHDINNALSVILPGTEALRDMIGHEIRHPDVGPIVADIAQAAGSCVDLARQALRILRIAGPRAPAGIVNVGEVVRSIERPLTKLLHGHGRLVVTLDPTIRQVRADRGSLERALVNLVINARDALAGSGTVHVRVKDDGGAAVVLEVQDDGRGIEAEALPRIFEPFFSTKLGEGTGLGLTVVKAAVDELGGKIEVESEPARGATFRLHLPAA